MAKKIYFNEWGEPCKTEKKYIFYAYTDKGGWGDIEIFDKKEDAVDYCKSSWNYLSDNDKKNYLNDPCGKFFVAPMWCIFDEDEGEWTTAISDKNGEDAYGDEDTMGNYTPIYDEIERNKK